MKKTIAPKTIAEMLQEGQHLISEQEHVRQEEMVQKEERRAQSWSVLRMQAIADLGELANEIPVEAPEAFPYSDRSCTFELRPFSAATLFVRYAEGALYKWYQHPRKNSSYSISVTTDFKATFDEDVDPEKWYVRTTNWRETDNISEALALCYNATEAYRKCDQECQHREPPMRIQKAESAPLTLTDAERNLMLSLRAMMVEKDD